MLIDEVKITLKAGHGGPGKISFRPVMGGPDGGNGGKGGNIYAVVTSDLTALNYFQGKHLIEATNGEMGKRQTGSGKDGDDLELKLPIGTSVIDAETGETIVELTDLNQRELICKGGLGGRGNAEFKSSTNTTPRYAQKGLPGEEKNVHLILRLIADYGLIGLPNAGKSSLLNELTRAQVKVANYPFTTLEPNLGVFALGHSKPALSGADVGSKIIADIPGLIEGASEGKGLGIKFLKHIEKVGLLIHCISSESMDVEADYQTVRKEMKRFNPELLHKGEIILLTKSDLLAEQELQARSKKLKKFSKTVLPISIHNWDSLESLKNILKEL